MFGENFKRIRLASKKTQKEVANALFISTQSISKWEKGLSLPSIDMLMDIASYFGCPINAFFSEYELQIFENRPHFSRKEIKQELKKIRSNKHIEINYGFGYVDNRVIELENNILRDALFLPAVYDFLKEHDTLRLSELQQHLMIGFNLGARIVDALFDLGILKEKEENGKNIRVIIKDKIDLLLPYIEKNSKKQKEEV